MSLKSSGQSRGLGRGGHVLAAVLFALVMGVTAAGQEPEVQKDVPYVPTPPEVVERMLKLGKAKKGDIHYDLGCGDGRIVITAVQKFGAARGTGYDIDPERIKEANENAENAGVTDKVKFILGNLFDADFRDATLVTLYLLPEVNMRLRPKLLKDLKVGSRIVSHQFNMGDWEPDDQIQMEWRTVYVWTVTAESKAKYAGD
ncbi:MAG: methyltransferase domain-containing protein [Bryobacteraceae bacterium]|nr:methyltransferase domain-containing protein [Bryobacteraceae bacterium]